MNPAPRSHEQLSEEITDLRVRLAETSEVLRAIRIGDVDAVLVQGPQGDQLFTLKGADEPYRVLIEEMNQGAVTLSADGSILYCNRRFAGLVKTPLERIVGHAFESFVAPSECAGFAALLEAGRTGGSAGEITLRAGDASAVPLQLALGPLPVESAAAICLIATDISESREKEARLHNTMADLVKAEQEAKAARADAQLKTETLQSTIFNSANFSCIATDAKGVIQIFNVGAERMLGYAAVDVINKLTPADLHDPQEVVERAAALSVEFGTPITPGFEALVFKAARGIEDIYDLTKVRKDGSRFPAAVSVTALRDAQDGIIGYLLIGTDNTARKQIDERRKQVEEALRESEARFQTVFENLSEGVVVSDLNGQLLHFNRSALDLHGFASLDECRRHLTEFGNIFELSGMDGEIWPLDQWPLARVLRGEKLRNLEARIRPLEGDWQRVFNYGGTLVHGAVGEAMMAVVSMSDITERKRFELALQQTNVELESARITAEKANLAKSDFLSSMSHELRSPLNAILGFAQLMESASPSPTASQTKHLAQILQAGWYLLKLINEVLDLAVIESGNVSLSKESVSLGELMSECQSMMEPQAQERGIRMSFPQFDNPLFVSADRTRLKQIVINLVSNAIKYNKEQGTVLVDCTVIAPERIRISVRDTGAGLPPEKLAQLFSPFNRLGQEAGSVAGTGIGLVVSKRLTEQMGGVIGVESTVGEGSVFWCEMISAEAPEVEVQWSEDGAFLQQKAPTAAPPRVLLYVEDNPANIQLVEELIARFPDLGLVTAVNGTLGIEVARATQPQVILMDINLPGISGTKALKILSEDPATAHIPVVALSANALPRDIAKGLEAGFFRYLTKPIKIKELMDTLNVALEFAEKPVGVRPNVKQLL